MEEDPEIDIEENPIMYPRIESIYSDVSIKAEPMEVEDGYATIEISANPDYYMPMPNKIILGSKPATSVQPEPKPGPSTASDNWEEENFFECSECSLIFSTQNELDSHKMSSHSFLVARPMSRAIKSERRISVSSNSSRSYLEDTTSQDRASRRQKAVKSTAKSALNNSFPILQNLLKNEKSIKKKEAPDLDGLLCKHCDVVFPNEIALIKHTYELLPEANIYKCEICHVKFESRLSLRGHMACHYKKTGDFQPSKDMMLQCAYCSCFLMYQGFMKAHLLKNHKEKEYAVKHVPYSGKCAICARNIPNYKHYNKHMVKFHRKIFFTKTPYRFDTTPIKLKCMVCFEIFNSRYAAYKHKQDKHPEQSQKKTFYQVYDNPVKEMPVDANISATQIVKAEPESPKFIMTKPIMHKYIPKDNVFKCNKCQIHFISCSAAFAHSKRCLLAKGDWKCVKCRRTFTMVEKPLHMQQHQFSDTFKVHIVCDKIISKVLCRCPKCELLFDELSFANHVSGQCLPSSGLDCKSCDLKIHLDSFAKHMRYHSKYNFSSADFIIIDFVDVSSQNAGIKELKTDQFKEKRWYCAACNCISYILKSKKKYHLEERCKTLGTRCCTICGLTFSKKIFPKHMYLDHEANNVKLNDIKFVRIQDHKVINPVMPTFFQCNKCNVNFISMVHKNNHSCSKIVYEKCSKCSKMFDSASYDIHLSFHNYGRGKTEDKKQSVVQMKLYSCVACNYGFHNYDSVVEHCQKHYTNTEQLATKLCKMCKLSYSEPHDTHSNRGFVIYKFDHEKLLLDDWLTGFGSLSRDAVDDILSKSTHGAIRNVRLELSVNGPSERTIYKCAQCELNFEQDYVGDHIIESCGNSPRFPCTSCPAVFKTRLAKNNHINVHVIYGDDITFREIVFNKENDKDLNEALRTGRQKESLKFRKCQQCELLIKASDYQTHVSEHNKVEVKKDNAKDFTVEVKQVKFRKHTDKNLAYKLFKPINAGRKLYTVYKCRNCKACILRKVSMIRHKCGPTYSKCSKCSLWFLGCNMRKHIELHALLPKFVPKNILLIGFQILNNYKAVNKPINKAAKKRRRYSSDDDDSTGTGVKVIVSKTYDTRKVVGRPYNDNFSEDSQDSNSNDLSAETASLSNAYAKRYIKKSCVEIVESDNESESSQNKIEYTPVNRKDLYDETLDMDKWRAEMKNRLYQCEKCYMCFLYRDILVKHLSECDNVNLSETPLTCDQCDMVFHPALTSFHEKLHALVRRNPIENYFYLVNISTNGVQTHDNKRWLHKCEPCDMHYINIKSILRHYSYDHIVQDPVRCEICGLQFTKYSRTRHMRIHHEQGDWSKEDLHIEIAHKIIVGEGEINLRAFIKPYTKVLTKECSIEIKPLPDIKSYRDLQEFESKDIEDTGISDYLENDSNIDSPNQATIDEKGLTDGSSKGINQIDHNLYKCNICFKHYLLKRTLERHCMEANHKMKPSECDICGLAFNKRTLRLHKMIQHIKLNLSREDFIINENVQDEIKEDATDSKDLNESEASESEATNASIDLNEEQNASLTDDLKEVSKQLKIDGKGVINNHIYKCVECSLFYTNRQTLLLHIIIRKHRQSKALKCDICGLVFGSRSLAKHKMVQHEKLKLTRKDFIIHDVFGAQLPDDVSSVQSDVQYASSIDTDDLPLTELEDKLESKRTQEDIKEKEKKIFKFYQCKDCKICIQKTERKLHVCCSDIQKKQCMKCCLYFRNSDVVQHKRLHHKYPELSRKHVVLIRFGCRSPKDHKIYKCVSCQTHFVSLNALEWHMNAWNHQTKRDKCNRCRLFFGKYSLRRHIYIHHNQLNLTLEQFNIVYVSDKKPTEIDGKTNEVKDVNNSNTTTESGTTSNVKTVKKLFKCIECDVYFLTRASYYHHIYKHKKLDETEYIDCNICDFQFLNESLGVHMKTHKDKSFSLDQLMIEVYQHNADLPKIECYFARDSLNSKLVSTTTPFDNDDENVLSQTDEQLSVIDSTSDEIPKTENGIVSVDPNTMHNTESSPEEGTLNVELPSSDVTVKVSD